MCKNRRYIICKLYFDAICENLITSPPEGGCEVLFSPGLSVCLCVCVSVCVFVCVSGQYFGILFLSY